MAHPLAPGVLRPRPAQDRTPLIELLVGAPVARLQRLRCQPRGLVDDVARVIQIPIVMQQPPLARDARVERRARIRRQDMERRGLDAM